MNEFYCRFEVEKPFRALLRPTIAGWERQRNTNYVSRGRDRAAEQHCIFHYCISGRGRIRWREKFYDIHPGEGFLCIINDSEMDYFYPEDGREEWSFLWFGYEDGNSRALTREMNERFSPVYALERDNRVLRRLFRLRAEDRTTQRLDAFDAARWVEELLAELRNNAENRQQRRLPNLVRRAMELANDRTPCPNAEVLADALGVSREYLSRSFRHATGTQLKIFLRETACERAKKLLTSPGRPLAEIAGIAGFSDSSSFIRMFRRSTGLTPGEYREKQQHVLFSAPSDAQQPSLRRGRSPSDQ